MPARHRNFIITAAAILLIAVFAGLQGFRQPASVSSDRDAVPEPGRKSQETRGSTDRRPPPDKGKAARLLELERLKKRWLEVQDQAARHYVTPELQALATESAESLLCSRELLGLLEYLEGRGLKIFADAIRRSVLALFESDLAPEARHLLAELSHESDIHIQRTLEEWSYHAGLSCSKEEFETFRASLGSEECALGASLGWNVQLAKSDPVDAMTSALQLLDSGVSSSKRHQVLLRLVDNIPPEADMAEIELLLPPVDSEKSTHSIEEGRSRLLVKWAKLDPAAAANHVMEHPERAEPKTIGLIAHAVLETNPRGGLEWIETFPPGPYLDAAARAVVEWGSRELPEVATRSALMIENEELRQKSIKEIQDAQANSEAFNEQLLRMEK